MILDPAEFRKVFRPKDAYEDDILWALGGGRDELIGYVGLPAVVDAELTTPTDTERAQAFKRALGHFAYAVLVTNAGSTLREGGRVKSEAFGEGEDVVYATPTETEQLAKQQRELGRRAIGIYLLEAETLSPFANVYRG